LTASDGDQKLLRNVFAELERKKLIREDLSPEFSGFDLPGAVSRLVMWHLELAELKFPAEESERLSTKVRGEYLGFEPRAGRFEPGIYNALRVIEDFGDINAVPASFKPYVEKMREHRRKTQQHQNATPKRRSLK